MSNSNTAPSQSTDRQIPFTDYMPALIELKHLKSGVDNVTSYGVFSANADGLQKAVAIIDTFKDNPITRIEVVQEDRRFSGTPRTGIFMFSDRLIKPALYIRGATLSGSPGTVRLSKRVIGKAGVGDNVVNAATKSVSDAPYTVVFWLDYRYRMNDNFGWRWARAH